MGLSLIAYPRIPIYSVADAAALAALTSMLEGDLAYQEDTKMWYSYDGTSWNAVSVDPAVIASDSVIITNSTERSVTSAGSYTKVKEIIVTNIPETNTLRVKYSADTSGSDRTGKFKTYKNGVAVGTENTVTDGAYHNFEDDFTNVVAGDRIQVYAYLVGAVGIAYVKDLKLEGTATPNNSVIGAWYDAANY